MVLDFTLFFAYEEMTIVSWMQNKGTGAELQI